MLGLLQLPQASNKTSQCIAWWKTCGVIRSICWTYSRCGRSKVIKAPNWSQHLRAMFQTPSEVENEGVRFQTCSCGAFEHVPAEALHAVQWKRVQTDNTRQDLGTNIGSACTRTKSSTSSQPTSFHALCECLPKNPSLVKSQPAVDWKV